MPKVLLGEIFGNQIGKNAIFHIKKSPFYKTTDAWSIDQKTPENPQNLGVFWSFWSILHAKTANFVVL